MFTNNNFFGEIENKKIEDYTKNLNYDIDNVEDRITFVKDKLGIKLDTNNIEVPDKIWETVFEQKGNIKLNANGKFYIDDNYETALSHTEFKNWCKDNDYTPEEFLYENDFLHKSSWSYVGDTSNIKLHLNTSDALYSESNVAKTLEILGSYILAKDDAGKDEQKIKTYNSRELFLRAIKEECTVNGLAPNSTGSEFAVFKMDKNYKKEIKDVVTAEDMKKYPVVKDYVDAYNHALKEYKALGMKQFLTPEENKRKYMLKKSLKGLKMDSIDSKVAFARPIKWKQPLKDNGCPNWDYLDLMDREHVKSLLQISINDDLQNDLACIRTDLQNIINRTEFTDRQKEVLKLWMRDIPISKDKYRGGQGIAEVLGVSHQTVDKILNQAIDNIINTYIEELEDWYYLNVCKGQYKRCSKCGEIKLVQRFRIDKKGKMGVRSKCKSCDKK